MAVLTILGLLAGCSYEMRCDKLEQADACASAALKYDLGVDVQPDPDKAKTYFERACALSDGASCIRLGVDAEQEEDEDSAQRAATYYQRACGLGHGQGCGQLAYLHQEGSLDGLKDYEAARVHHETGCDLGFGRSCFAAGRLKSEGRAIERDLEDARVLFDKGCKAADKDDDACEAAEQTTCSEDQIADWTAACEGDDVEECRLVGDCHLMGWGAVSQSNEKAAEWYGKACEGGSRVGCNALAVMHMKGMLSEFPDYFEAVGYFKRACFKRRWPGSCRALGDIMKDKLDDIERARKYYGIGCEAGTRLACDALAELPPAPKDPEAEQEAEAE